MKEHTYKAYERDKAAGQKGSILEYDNAVAWADLLDVRFRWLLDGEGAPFKDEASSEFSPEVRDVAEILQGKDPETRSSYVEAIKTLLGRTGTGG